MKARTTSSGPKVTTCSQRRPSLRALAMAVAVAVPVLLGCDDDSGAPARDAASDLLTSRDQAATSDVGSTADTAAIRDGASSVDSSQPGPDAAQATVLDDKHAGWQQTQCAGAACHNPPVPDHTATEPPACAECHGGNGACDPPAAHAKSMMCTNTACHGSDGHGFGTKADCLSCHYAALGTAKCP